jgi:AAA15 family ATPase/GTPase
MKIKTVTLKNFRAYKDDTVVDFEDLTAFVGKNDIGKSSVLEALDVFFNDGTGVVKLDKGDINYSNAEVDNTISITVELYRSGHGGA